MTVVNVSVLWLLVSLMYMGSAVYMKLFIEEELPPSVPAMFLFIGWAIFLLVNSTEYLSNDFHLQVAEVVTIATLMVAWALGIVAVRQYIRLVSNRRP